MSSKEIYFYENINTEPFISILKLRSSYASEPVIIYKNNQPLHLSRLYTPAFICNHKHFRSWRYQQCLDHELWEKCYSTWSVIAQCPPQPDLDLWLRLKNNISIHTANYNEKTTLFTWGWRLLPYSAPAPEQLASCSWRQRWSLASQLLHVWSSANDEIVRVVCLFFPGRKASQKAWGDVDSVCDVFYRFLIKLERNYSLCLCLKSRFWHFLFLLPRSFLSTHVMSYSKWGD